MKPSNHYKTIFVSDWHLGTKGCDHKSILDFLEHNTADTWYFVGDIIDGWRLKAGWYFPPEHLLIVQKILKIARKSKVIYLPGNHDEFAKKFIGNVFGGIEVFPYWIHETSKGDKILVLHGDEHDVIEQYAKWLAVLGAGAYEIIMFFNRITNRVRYRCGLSRWSFSNWAKQKTKSSLDYMLKYGENLSKAAKSFGTTKVIYGHVHTPSVQVVNDIEIYNIGDFVENTSYITEDYSGTLKILHWD